MKHLFNGAFEGQTVLVTGHTGFKGAWLTTWLLELGANVVGFSLPTLPTDPSMFDLLGLSNLVTDIRGDIAEFEPLLELIQSYRPTVIFHMAAQPIVLTAINDPKPTFDTNAGGTVNVLEAVRLTDSVKALICITTDKVYTDHNQVWGYREGEQLGGKEPYSASKAMAELAIHAYRETYFRPSEHAEHGVGIASVRAGNVIGGGDLADFRLVPDCMRALMAEEPIEVRNPAYIRPWQHVLVPLSGYLLIAEKLLNGDPSFAEAWNFGPAEMVGIPVQAIAEKLIELWGSGEWVHTNPDLKKHETFQLRLSWEKAAQRLRWDPIYTWEDALEEIVTWFRAYQAGDDLLAVTRGHIDTFVEQAGSGHAPWA